MRYLMNRLLPFVITPFCLFLFSASVNAQIISQFGVLKSTDHGKTWTRLATGNRTVDQLAVDGSGHILLGSMSVSHKNMHSDLFAAEPRTAVFRQIPFLASSSQNAQIYDLFTASDGSILLRTPDRLLRTTDGGSNWTLINDSLPHFRGNIHLGPDGSLLAFTKDGLYSSQDQGHLWEYVGFRDKDVQIKAALEKDIFIVGWGCQLLINSVYQNRLDELKILGIDCPGMSGMTTDRKNLLVLGAPDGVYTFDLLRSTLKKIYPFKFNTSVAHIEVAPSGEIFLALADGPRRTLLFRSDDTGATWKQVVTLGVGVGFSNFAFAPDGTIYAGLTSVGD